ncbi:MAG TPA: flagellar export protein FliJ [Thermopetrobacter sp.]|nr:flagellar export protein FliJ [Thermopetrobacter sp.]
MPAKDWRSRVRLHRFKVEEARRQVGEIELMIGELSRKRDELTAGIRFEEERSGVGDPGHVQYPPAALDMRKRRDNLDKSISDLKEQLQVASARVKEAQLELEKAELMLDKQRGEMAAEADGMHSARPM